MPNPLPAPWNRKYVRMSLGGGETKRKFEDTEEPISVHAGELSKPEASRIKNALIILMRLINWPVIVRGDPAAALLEVLDTEQNYAFRDHYLEVPFDYPKSCLSPRQTRWYHTRPLLDRMEVYPHTRYTEYRKNEYRREILEYPSS